MWFSSYFVEKIASLCKKSMTPNHLPAQKITVATSQIVDVLAANQSQHCPAKDRYGCENQVTLEIM
jgi:hypothetical protein